MRQLLTIAVLAAATLPSLGFQEPGSGSLLGRQIHDQHLAGMGVIVVRAQTVVEIAVAGVRKRGEDTQIAPADLFHLGSNTKAITATMIARLIEAGKLSFTTSPEDVFPELRQTMHPAFRRVTIEQLLSHHAGIPAYTNVKGPQFKALPHLTGDGTAQRSKFAAWVLQHPPAYKPGTKGLYSNAGISIAAAMVERITGLSWEALVNSQVLEPLGMHAIYGYPLSYSRNEPWGHAGHKHDIKAVDLDAAWKVPPYLLPAGGMAMSLSDYGKFLQMNLRALRGAESKFLATTTVERLHTSPAHDEYALGWGTFQSGGVRTSSHAGSGGSFYALVKLQPERDIAIAVLANSSGKRTEVSCDEVLEALLAKWTEPGSIR